MITTLLPENGSSVKTGAVNEIETFPFTDAKPAVIGRGGARNLAVLSFCTMAGCGREHRSRQNALQHHHGRAFLHEELSLWGGAREGNTRWGYALSGCQLWGWPLCLQDLF
ncbi:hypothetical protein [Photorhabdus khanii]|uniref:hypothetical protein n=1 Tax=Photorhabdus khanii TaxID=1004150 RepID=UPI001FD87150|nr:hypothetical protein [Photorhabdus khanii]